MSRGMAESGNFIFMIAFALIFTLGFSILLSPLLRQTPKVEVSDCSLTSDNISNNGSTSITFTLKSNDDNASHEIKVEFSSYVLVTFMLGSQNLPRSNDIWYYTETLNPSASHTQLINVKASLESGISKLDYHISVNFSMDGEQFYSKSLDLTVHI